MTIEMTIERNDIEQDITVTLKYHKGYDGSWEQPPEPAEYEITSVRDAAGNNIEITDSEAEEAIELAFAARQTEPCFE